MFEKLGLYVVLAAVMFGTGVMTGRQMFAAAEIRAEVRQLKQNEVVVAGDSKTAAADRLDLDKMDQIAKDTIDAMPNPDAECLDSNDVDQLRKLWGEGPSSPAR